MLEGSKQEIQKKSGSGGEQTDQKAARISSRDGGERKNEMFALGRAVKRKTASTLSDVAIVTHI